MSAFKTDSIRSRAFGIVCLTEILGYARHFMLVPTLPLYVTEFGATAFTVGLVLACFAVTSEVIRPLFGSFADRWGEAQVIVGGVLILAVSGCCVCRRRSGYCWSLTRIGALDVRVIRTTAVRAYSHFAFRNL